MMSTSEPLDKEVRRVVAAVLKMPCDTPDFERAQQPAWDSLKHIEIVFALEDRFGVEFAESEIPALCSVAVICRVLRERNAT